MHGGTDILSFFFFFVGGGVEGGGGGGVQLHSLRRIVLVAGLEFFLGSRQQSCTVLLAGASYSLLRTSKFRVARSAPRTFFGSRFGRLEI